MQMGKLKLQAFGGFRVRYVCDYLTSIEHAYDSVYAFGSVLDSSIRSVEELERYWPPPIAHGAAWMQSVGDMRGRSRFLRSWPPSPEEIASLVPPRHRLILAAVKLQSPGAWEFVGALNPLEVLRQYLADRHERVKDKAYRSAAEKERLELENERLRGQVAREREDAARTRREHEYRSVAEARQLELENQLRENKVLAERIQMAKSLGATDQDLTPLLNEFIYRPLHSLDSFQDGEAIEGAEVLELTEGDIEDGG